MGTLVLGGASRFIAAIPTPYTGQVATRCRIPSQINGNNKGFSRTKHRARDAISALKLVFPNWYVDASHIEQNGAAAMQITASIEYPDGVFTQVRFGGAVMSPSTAAGANIESDFVNVSIPNGAWFWVRCYIESTANILFGTSMLPLTGESFMASGSQADWTMTAGAPTQSVGNLYGPCAIVAQTVKPSVLLIGDSIVAGTGDTSDENTGDFGIFARPIGQRFGYISVARSGDRAQRWVAGAAKRAALGAYCSHIISDYGVNDLNAGARTPAQLLADLATIAGQFAGKPFMQSTLPPYSTSTDSWATVANQTTVGTNANRVSVNNTIREGGIAGVTLHLEIADALENAPDTGIWRAGLTGDGLHPNRRGYGLVLASGAVQTDYVSR